MIRFAFSDNGTLSMTADDTVRIAPSPVGMLFSEGSLLLPDSLVYRDGSIMLSFGKTIVTLSVRFRKNGSLRLCVTDIPDHADGFVFGPYAVPETEAVGEIVGAAWQSGGGIVCIQSLNPKTVGECPLDFMNETGWYSPANHAAYLKDGYGILSCSAENMTRPKLVKRLYGNCYENVIAEPVEGPDGPITGAAVVLTCAKTPEALLSDLGELEVEEGLPHPTIDGTWAKTSPAASDAYLVFSGGDTETQIRMAERAGIHYIYFSDPFASWGHFDINRSLYPGGKKEFAGMIEKARAHGVNVGFHTLSNFIHTHDPYVSPVPHKELLAYDPVPLAKDISDTDTVIPLSRECNYGMSSPLRTARIGDELISYTGWDRETGTLTGCTRGAFGTSPCSHAAGDEVTRLADHGYRTFFPSLRLQGEMADNIGRLIRDTRIRRMSFDGIEGLFYTGRGEYAASEYVRRIFAVTGGELLTDASNGKHYRWHAHSYFNWGEFHYDSDHRGGNYNFRARNQEYFRRNLLPGMLGWYRIFDNLKGKFEATSVETLESFLATSAGFNAGLCIAAPCEDTPRMRTLLDKIRIWQKFRRCADIPEVLRSRLKLEHTDWRLEETEDCWILSELDIRSYDLDYNTHTLIMESGTTGWSDGDADPGEAGKPTETASIIVIDRASADPSVPEITEPLYCRIRVGTPLEKGHLHSFSFCSGWFSKNRLLSFDLEADGGDYLIYRGTTTLERYDCNFNPICTYEGTGSPIIVEGDCYSGFTFRYVTTGDALSLVFTHIRTKDIHEIPFS